MNMTISFIPPYGKKKVSRPTLARGLGRFIKHIYKKIKSYIN